MITARKIDFMSVFPKQVRNAPTATPKHLAPAQINQLRASRRLPLIPCPHSARALQSTASDRSHTVGFNCRLTCGGSTFGIELGPPRNTSIHASETECSPSSLTLCLAKRVTPASVAVALDLCSCTRGICTGITHGSAIARAREIAMRTTDIVHPVGTLHAS